MTEKIDHVVLNGWMKQLTQSRVQRLDIHMTPGCKGINRPVDLR
ncbi:hypothetical protein [Gluconobacter sphaericus]|uniref:Uncharacterized protein n=1 Tax=Gluconobacter sphaericus NBRC 12467 TaxID=1307951 RepID=A0AA37SLV9_9PROT|nr:hypothetical protein [Gluconobacter sphaericus]GEB42982.1 hypothetical protein GSP01_17640 [Gluconobacter sphaericus NBRC 12467]GLQ86433.1 hypothetical protein GCM10007872_33480 [Gluconobacter sphaericus NBRC 12467]